MIPIYTITIIQINPNGNQDNKTHAGEAAAFGGATLVNPWQTIEEYTNLLQRPPYNCDLVIPLEHLYVPDDHITCSNFDFPIVLSGHDHHRVDETVDGTRLIKPGCDGDYAAVIEICWDGMDSKMNGNVEKEQKEETKKKKPTISSRFVKVADWDPCPVLQEINNRAYDALIPLRMTELTRVPKIFHPLSSMNARNRVTTMGMFLCSLLRSSLNVKCGITRVGAQEDGLAYVDAVILMGGNIRGNTDYNESSVFSLEALMAEIEPNEQIGVVEMPGWVLARDIEETHAGDPIPGWIQYDCDIKECYPHHDDSNTGDHDGHRSVVTHVSGQGLDPTRMYRVATKISDLTNGQSPTFTKYYTSNPNALPDKGSLINVSAELMSYFARNVWQKIWESLDPSVSSRRGIHPTSGNEGFVRELLHVLDHDGDGCVEVYDIYIAMRDILGLGVHSDEMTFSKAVHCYADRNNDGKVTGEGLEMFRTELPALYKSDRWQQANAKPAKPHLITPRKKFQRYVTFTREPVAFQNKFPFV